MMELLHAWQLEVEAEGMDSNPEFIPGYNRELYLKNMESPGDGEVIADDPGTWKNKKKMNEK